MNGILTVTPTIRIHPYQDLQGLTLRDPCEWTGDTPHGYSVETGEAHGPLTLWFVEADFATLEDAIKAANGCLILTRSNAGPGTGEAMEVFDTWLVYEISGSAAHWLEWGARCDEQTLEEALEELSAQLGAEIVVDLGART